MKTTMLKMMMVAFLLAGGMAYGQYDADQELTKKEIRQREKAMDRETYGKASSQARKEAKTLKRAGYKVPGIGLPIEKQLDQAWRMAAERDETGKKRYLIANQNITGQNYAAAKMQAMSLAKVEIADKIASDVDAMIENSVMNEQITRDEATSLTKTIHTSNITIAQRLGEIESIYEIYKDLKNQNVKVQLSIAYNRREAMQLTKEVSRRKLQQEGIQSREKLDRMMGVFNEDKTPEPEPVSKR